MEHFLKLVVDRHFINGGEKKRRGEQTGHIELLFAAKKTWHDSRFVAGAEHLNKSHSIFL